MKLQIVRLVTLGGLELGGAAALVYGVHQVFPPAAWMLGGLLAVLTGVALSGGDKKAPR